MKKLLSRSFAFAIVTSSMVLTVPVFAESTENTKNIDIISNVDKNNTDIMPFEVSYDYSNYKITSKTNFQVSITLSNFQPYGKVHYYNSSDYVATLYVEGEEKTIEPHSGDSIVWKKGTFKSSYDVGITASEGRLNGTFSLAKAERESEFQK